MQSRLVYVIGASGSGKDSVMRYARERLGDEPRVVFAHRYITRPAGAGGENHIELSRAEYDARLRIGLFALAWESHGYAYGVGVEINQWLAKGITVTVNGSREFLPEAKRRFPELLPVLINVSPDVLRERLAARGREDSAIIEARLQRHVAMQDRRHDGVVISNNGLLSKAGEALIELIRDQIGQAPCG